jgi:hypothetical protein
MREGSVDHELVRRLQEFTREALLWSSTSVIKQFEKFKDTASGDPYTGMIEMDGLMRQMRTDLGHSNRGLAEGELLKLFLKDPGELDRILAERRGRPNQPLQPPAPNQ